MTIRKICQFDYLPISKIITSFFQSQTFCHEILALWHNKKDWLQSDSGEVPKPEYIDQFWHGTKMVEYSNFWDLGSDWTLPIVCSNSKCNKVYRLWPSLCEELDNDENFNEDTMLPFSLCGLCNKDQPTTRNYKGNVSYILKCILSYLELNCDWFITTLSIIFLFCLFQGSPFNIALMGHWDGFQVATTIQKDCWTIEIVILNVGKRPLPNSPT